MSDVRPPGTSITFGAGGGVPVRPSVTVTPLTELLQTDNNLDDVANKETAVENLGVPVLSLAHALVFGGR